MKATKDSQLARAVAAIARMPLVIDTLGRNPNGRSSIVSHLTIKNAGSPYYICQDFLSRGSWTALDRTF